MITKIKIFNEYDEQHVFRVGIKCFWANLPEMNLISVKLVPYEIKNLSRRFERTDGC